MHHCVGIIASPQKAMHIGLLEGIYFNIVEAILGLPGKFTEVLRKCISTGQKHYICLFIYVFVLNYEFKNPLNSNRIIFYHFQSLMTKTEFCVENCLLV